MECQRHLFSLPENQHYLNCAYMSPLLKTAEAAGIVGLQRKARPATITVDDFFAPVEALRVLCAQLIHTSPERIALIPAVSYGVAIATRNLALRPGQNVVVSGEEFPSNVYGWMVRCSQAGAELRIVPRPTQVSALGQAWTLRLLEAIDHNTAAVTLSTIHWTDGTPLALESITQRAREVGALVVVDGTQSVGAAPFDFDRLQPDLLLCAGYKWLLGPYQCGFAAVGDRFLAGRPVEETWSSRQHSQDFSQLMHYQSDYQPGARRFDAGERANFILLPMLAAGLHQILDWHVERIQAYCARLAHDFACALERSPYTLAPVEDRSAHLFSIRVPDPRHMPVVLGELRRREVYVSQRGTAVRISPHVYNTSEDMAVLADALHAALP